MKSAKGLIYLVLLGMLVACGKGNESGKKNQNGLYGNGNPYSFNPYTNPTGVNSPYNYGGMSINQVMMQNPCISGFGGMMGMPGSYAGQRMPITVPLLGFPSVISPGDIYVGVTSYGDVAVISGQGLGAPPLFTGYMCPRSFAPQGQGQLLPDIKIGAYTRCLFKSITKATVVFPGGGVAAFRWLDGGNSMGQRFNFCTL